MSHSASVCLFSARHQNAALAILKQILITQLWADTRWPNFLFFNPIGVSETHQLGVAAFVNGVTIGCKPRLDLALFRNPEYGILSRRVNMCLYNIKTVIKCLNKSDQAKRNII